MGFRGMLLSSQTLNEESFRIVTPDAKLSIVQMPNQIGDAICEDYEIVVTDSISGGLLQVIHLTHVRLLPQSLSTLWLREHNNNTLNSINAPCIEDLSSTITTSDNVLPKRRKELDSPSASLNHTLLQSNSSTLSDSNHIAYCFHFQSRDEFNIFQTTHEAFLRLEKYTLLEKTILNELCIREDTMKDSPIKLSGQSFNVQSMLNHQDRSPGQPSRNMKQRLTEKRSALKSEKQRDVETVEHNVNHSTNTNSSKSKRARSVSTVASCVGICIICGTSNEPHTFTSHPFVLQNGIGESVELCKPCLQQLVKQRMRSKINNDSSELNCCLCGSQSDKKQKRQQKKACAHSQCLRSYCYSCLVKLIGADEAKRAIEIPNWICTSCRPNEDDSNQPDPEPTIDQPKKKRGRAKKQKTSTPPPTPAPESITDTNNTKKKSKNMTMLDYASTYFSFLTKREARSNFLDESEDSCFCCKDGGVLVECDWKGSNNLRCPKVYHEDCLGYDVSSLPDEAVWRCPRHRCKDCGLFAQHCCRFCVTSFCNEHLPSHTKRLGYGSAEISHANYVVCENCKQVALAAYKAKNLSHRVYKAIFTLPFGNATESD